MRSLARLLSLPPMLALVLLAPLALAALARPAAAQQAAQPRKLGQFQSWTAATLVDGGHKVCYIFARASKAEGVVNRAPTHVLLTVTHRAAGRDAVALRVGYTYPRTTDGRDPVRVSVGTTEFPFYTSQDTAFTRENGNVVRALRAGRDAVARGPGPNNRGTATDTFPLAGFAQAYDLISRECPPGAATDAAPARR